MDFSIGTSKKLDCLGIFLCLFVAMGANIVIAFYYAFPYFLAVIEQLLSNDEV